ncbi:unnamed protein product, partial [marine sediment metagenome]
MNFNVVSGLPRSGSTLFCNILNQNPRFFASSTSNLIYMTNSIITSWSSSLEMKNLLGIEKEKTEKRMQDSLRQFVDGWYRVEGKDIIFDKSRGWTLNYLMLQSLFPDSKLLVMVRDIRNVFSSIEKQYRKNPLLDDVASSIGKTVYHRADHMFSPEGLIGSSIVGIEDLIRRRKSQNILFVFYEELSVHPEESMRKVYDFLEEDYFPHNFENVVNTAVDPDSFFLNKFPHDGSGKV